MPALVAGIHVLLSFCGIKDVDGRVKPGHDGRCGPQWESYVRPPGTSTILKVPACSPLMAESAT